MQMKQQNRVSSGLELPYGTRYPHLTYGFQSEVLLRPPQYQPTKSDLFFPPLSQVLYKPTPTYHSPRVFLPVLHQGTSPTLQFPVYHEPQGPLDYRHIRAAPILRRTPKPLLDGTLTLQDVVEILRLCIYNETKQDVTCPVCCKKYKSKVCLTKHLWEHTIYWSQFQGMKNHERVLCIQTALILSKNPYSSILVTAPCKKKTKHNRATIERCVNKSPAKDVKNSEVMKLSRSFTEQENQVTSPHSDSVEDFLHFTSTINENARTTAHVHSSPKIKRKRVVPPHLLDHNKDLTRLRCRNPQQGWLDINNTPRLSPRSFTATGNRVRLQTTFRCQTPDSKSIARTAEQYDRSRPMEVEQYSSCSVGGEYCPNVVTTTSPTATSQPQTTSVSSNNRVSPQNHSGDSGADDSGYGTSERQDNSYQHETSWEKDDLKKEYRKEDLPQNDSNDNNKRLAEFIEEQESHQGQERKIRKFDSESNESSSSCQPISQSSSSDEGQQSSQSCVSRESDFYLQCNYKKSKENSEQSSSSS
ncbi:uncharacterized protein LOC134820794 [Bolinopsis microptera]|uniref:uncharacterized protein LOC134820794 n=1 Tax=Bolinopsis microptera TaxID=2820187 RepID=UPI0030797827